MRNQLILLLAFVLFVFNVSAQEEDLLGLLDEEETTEYVEAAFKTTRVVNSHSLENVSEGVLDFKISHRFGEVNQGVYDLFGLDRATLRLGFDYGVTDRFMIGVGRSTVEKAYDGFVKYKILRQSTGAKQMPVTLIWISTAAVNTLRWPNEERDNLFSSRMSYTHQAIVGRKFSKGFSAQLMPTAVHKNLVATREDANTILAMGIAGRQKIGNRIAINAEYYHVLPDQITQDYHNSLSLGIDIETGGHVFQLHFTNSTAMIEKGFITETGNNWLDGEIHFGFNISRVFTVKKPEEFKKERVKRKAERAK